MYLSFSHSLSFSLSLSFSFAHSLLFLYFLLFIYFFQYIIFYILSLIFYFLNFSHLPDMSIRFAGSSMPTGTCGPTCGPNGCH